MPLKHLRVKEAAAIEKSANQPSTSESNSADANSLKDAKKKIKELEEQLELLRLENAVLRERNGDNDTPSTSTKKTSKKAKTRNLPEDTDLNKTTRQKSQNLRKLAVLNETRRESLPTNNSDTDQQSQQTLKDLGVKGCSCNGVCGNKKCGCVKKNMRCSPEFCRCQDGCINKSISNDNENENKENAEESNKIEEKNKTVKNKKDKTKKTEDKKENKKGKNKSKNNNKKSAQPNEADSSTNINLPNVDPNKNREKTPPPATTSASIFDTPKTSQPSNNVQSIESGDEVIDIKLEIVDCEEVINPMQPRHQLLRSPIVSRPENDAGTSFIANNTINNSTIVRDDDRFLPVPLPVCQSDSDGDELPPPEINEAEIDWDEHKSKLVQCQICKRKFYRHRIKVHQKSCKKI